MAIKSVTLNRPSIAIEIEEVKSYRVVSSFVDASKFSLWTLTEPI